MARRAHVMWVPNTERDKVVAALSKEFDLCIHSDPKRKGLIQNWGKAVRCAAKEADQHDWSIILSDDVLPLDGWREHLEQALANSPSPLLGLMYCGSMIPELGKGKNAYVQGPYVLRGGGVAYRNDVVEELARFATFTAYTGYPNDDMAACFWAKWHGFLPAALTRTIFHTPKFESLLGHSPMGTGRFTIESYPDLERYSNGHVAKMGGFRDDELEFWEMLRQVGWDDPTVTCPPEGAK